MLSFAHNFTAIDFETATGYRNSACSVGIVVVRGGEIVDTYQSLIQPPGNSYWFQLSRLHGIWPEDTANAPTFAGVLPEIRRRIEGRCVVAHNERFDRSVLSSCMEMVGADYEAPGITAAWDCTLALARSLGQYPCDLASCCLRQGIELRHHDALSDAMASAHLWTKLRVEQSPNLSSCAAIPVSM